METLLTILRYIGQGVQNIFLFLLFWTFLIDVVGIVVAFCFNKTKPPALLVKVMSTSVMALALFGCLCIFFHLEGIAKW